MTTKLFRLAAAALLLVAFSSTNLAAQTRKWDNLRTAQGLSLPTWDIKTNLVADLTASMNLGAEVRTGSRTSFELVGQWNPWMFRDNVRMQHWGVQPEFRVWTREAFRGHFFGVQAHYADYNMGGLPNGPFSSYMHENRFEGDLYGAGVTWGHRWNFSRRWGLEVTVAAGWAHKEYDRYECESCGKLLAHTSKNYFGPTEMGVNLIFGGGSKKAEVVAPPPSSAPSYAPATVQQSAPEPEPERTPEPETAPAGQQASPAAPESVKEVPQEVRQAMMNLSDILFAFDRFNLNEAAVAELDKVVEWLVENPEVKIELGGHTDSTGSEEYNMQLSKNRVKSVQDYLTAHGVDASRLSSHSYGESQPVADNDTPEGRRLNRRVELNIVS
jgi:outer membrane protein OmpA-like peptidoglycan-associated protein